MANITTEQQAEATFEGIRFRVRTESISNQGRRIILHEYLDSDRIFAEDIGEIPPQFSVDAFIHSDRSQVAGQVVFPNFIQKAEQFRNVLRQKRDKPGLLTLPTIGTFQAIALSFSEDRSQSAVGEVRFSIQFVKAAGSIAAVEAPASSENLFSVTDQAREEIQTEAITKWNTFVLPIELPSLDLNAYLTVLDDITSIPNDIANKARNFLDAGTFGRIKDSIRNFTNVLPNLISIPADLFGYIVSGVEDVIGLFQDLSNAFTETGSSNALSLADELGRTGSGLPTDMLIIRARTADPEATTIDSFDKPLFSNTTIQRQQRSDARELMLDVFRAGWLLIAFEQAAIADYLTDADVDDARDTIENLYDNIVSENLDNEKSIFSNLDVLDAINQSKRLTLSVLEQKEQSAYRVTTFDYKYVTSAIEISYQLYAEEINTPAELEARSELIANLNPEQRPDRMTGAITVLQVR